MTFWWKELTLHGWDLWDEIRIPLDKEITIVSGENGSGKTTLLDAMRQLLNARRLSEKRRVQDYVRDPARGVLIRAIVGQESTGTRLPFSGEGVNTDELTLACTLRPRGSGSPEKRFLIAEGVLSPEEITKRTSSSGEWVGPEEYRRALRNAGVSKSLMNVLTLPQGSIDELSQLSPRELFRRVLDVLGDKEIIERYENARETLRKAQERVSEHQAELHRVQGRLDEKREQVRRLNEYEELQEDLEGYQARGEAAKLQAAYQELDDLQDERGERREELNRTGKLENQKQGELQEAKKELETIKNEREEVESRRERAREARDDAKDGVSKLQSQVEGLQEKEQQIKDLPDTPVDEAREKYESVHEAAIRAHDEVEQLEADLERLQEECRKLEDGIPVYPQPVEATLEALEAKGIEHDVVAQTVEPTDDQLVEAIESALSDLRFGLVVDSGDHKAVVSLAREHGFPGPIYSGPTSNTDEPDALDLQSKAPKWLEEELGNIDLREDGTWVDEHGTWVRRTQGLFLGRQALRKTLEKKREAIEATEQELEQAQDRAAQLDAERDEASEHLDSCRQREQYESDVEELPSRQEELSDARTQFREAEDHRKTVEDRFDKVSQREKKLEARIETLEDRIDGLQEKTDRYAKRVAEIETKLEDTQEKIDNLEDEVRSDLIEAARKKELLSRSRLRELRQECRESLENFGEVPDPQIRQEVATLENSLEEVRDHLNQSAEVRENAQEQVRRAKENFLRNVSETLRRFRERVNRFSEMAGVTSDVVLPPLQDPDTDVLDEAGLEVRFGFDEKDPVLMRDPSFSGGQKVIAGLVIVMAMADIEGSTFFIIDEPFAHLSVDRIDQVSRFLRSTESQFILTVPTGLARQDLDPGSQLIRLRKKPPEQEYAPDPIRVVA